jgi:hypothetical protein
MRKIFMMLTALTVLTLSVNARPLEDGGVNEEGFIQKWLVLAPIPLAENQPGSEGLDKEQVKEEAKLKPKLGDKVKVGEKEYEWKEKSAKDHLVDLNAALGGQTEDSVAYAVSYVVASEEMKDVKLKVGSDDQAKFYLNGKEVLKFAEARATDKDQNTATVTLNKGVNVLVAKIVNEKIEWSFCARFTDKDDKPLTKLKSQTKE